MTADAPRVGSLGKVSMQSTQQSRIAIGAGGAMGAAGRSNAAPDARKSARGPGGLIIGRTATNLAGGTGFDGKSADMLFGFCQRPPCFAAGEGAGIILANVRPNAGTTCNYTLAPAPAGRPAIPAQS